MTPCGTFTKARSKVPFTKEPQILQKIVKLFELQIDLSDIRTIAPRLGLGFSLGLELGAIFLRGNFPKTDWSIYIFIKMDISEETFYTNNEIKVEFSFNG